MFVHVTWLGCTQVLTNIGAHSAMQSVSTRCAEGSGQLRARNPLFEIGLNRQTLYKKNAKIMPAEFKKEYQLVVIGEGGVGKSALSVQFIQGHFVDEYDPTIEDSYRKEIVIDNESIALDILDTAGQEEYSAMREQYVRSGQGFLIVFSVTSRASFDAVQSLYQLIMRSKNNDSSFPMVLIGNKADLVSERQVAPEEGIRLANRLELPYIETSAKTQLNVEASFRRLASSVLKYQTRPPRANPPVIADSQVQALYQRTKKDRTSCCLIA